MRHSRFSLFRIASGLLLSTALFACDGTTPIAVEDGSKQASVNIQQCTNVQIDAIYSGPPTRENGVINLNDQWVYVEIYDITRFTLPSPRPSPSDVRMGDSFETGTPAESYQILDINDDGRPDIRVRFSKFALIDDGNLDRETEELQVWGLNRANNGEYCATEPVEVIIPPPAPGQDVVVFNDINVFDNIGGFRDATNPGNVRLVQNLVLFEADGPRDEGNVVWFDRGRNSRCGTQPGSGCMDDNLSRMRGVITDVGMSIQNIESTAGSLTSIPGNVKVIFLWNPMVAYTVPEINTLKQFAAEGGRIVFVGEHEGYYGEGIPIQNQFLGAMGAVMRNIGEAVDCGLNTIPSESIREHQVTDGVESIDMGCASVIEPGPQDFILFYDISQTRVLAGVARIDTAPISSLPAQQMMRIRATATSTNPLH